MSEEVNSYNRRRPGRPSNVHSTGQDSVLLYLRTSRGLSQRELSKVTGLTTNDISRMENGRRGLPLDKVLNLTGYFSVTLNTLLTDDFAEILTQATTPIAVDQRRREAQRRHQVARERVGFAGEDYVYQLELEKLRGTPYANAPNPNYAGESKTHFDILSVTPKGRLIYIEVKSTPGHADEPFYMSAAEYSFMLDCIKRGRNYELHRVYYVDDPGRRGRIIYTAQDVLREFEMTASNYMFRKAVK